MNTESGILGVATTSKRETVLTADGTYPGESQYELRRGTGVAVDKFGCKRLGHQTVPSRITDVLALWCAHVMRKEGSYKDDTD